MIITGMCAAMVLLASTDARSDILVKRKPKLVSQLNGTAGENRNPDLTLVRSEAFQGFRFTWQNYTSQKVYWTSVNRYGQVGAEMEITESDASGSSVPSISGIPEGDFIISWSEYIEEAGSTRILGKRYNSSGSPMGDPMVIEYADELDYVGDYYLVESQEITAVDLPGQDDHTLLLGWLLNAPSDRDNTFGRLITFPQYDWGTIPSYQFLGSDPDEPGHLDNSTVSPPWIYDSHPSILVRDNQEEFVATWTRADSPETEVRFSTFTLPGGYPLLDNVRGEIADMSQGYIDRDVDVAAGGFDDFVVQWEQADNLYVRVFDWDTGEAVTASPRVINRDPISGTGSGYWGNEVVHVSDDNNISHYISVWNSKNGGTGLYEIHGRPFWIEYDTSPPSLVLGTERVLARSNDQDFIQPRAEADSNKLYLVFAGGESGGNVFDIYFGTWLIYYPYTP